MFSRSVLLSLLAPSLLLGAVLKDFESPEFTAFYQLPLPIPPIKQPKM